MPRDEATEMVRRQIEANICYFGEHGELLEKRVAELEREWSLESALELGLGLGGTVGFLMNAFKRGRIWRAVNLAAVGMMLQFAASGRCGAYRALRKMGFRTTGEIELERCALKSLRGGLRSAPESAMVDS